MAASSTAIAGEGHNLSQFLSSLKMKMTISNRSNGDMTRAVQLINKTNQFNINSIRRTPEEIVSCILEGGKLFTAEISDVNGDHLRRIRISFQLSAAFCSRHSI
jgi:predicted enzyme involved in methoxymalonyl-ACP biosynthesis